MKKYVFQKKDDKVLRWDAKEQCYKYIGSHKDFKLHSDWGDRWKEKVMRDLDKKMREELC